MLFGSCGHFIHINAISEYLTTVYFAVQGFVLKIVSELHSASRVQLSTIRTPSSSKTAF
jgi:hypothetical protein